MRYHALLLMIAATLLVGCAGTPKDYTQYRQHMPKTVLVLPPLNHTNEVMASDKVMATITQPVAEMGYYVYPITLVNEYMKQNGLPTPGEMRQAPLNKLYEVYGAEAVLYVDIDKWATHYLVIGASTEVTLKYRLVDTRSGVELWTHTQEFVQNSGSAGGGIAGAVVSAAIHTANKGGIERQTAAQCNAMALCDPKKGLLAGARNPEAAELNAKR